MSKIPPEPGMPGKTKFTPAVPPKFNKTKLSNKPMPAQKKKCPMFPRTGMRLQKR